MWVANLVGQRGIRTGSKGVPVRYEAIDASLGLLADKAVELGASVHMPRIGCAWPAADGRGSNPSSPSGWCAGDWR